MFVLPINRINSYSNQKQKTSFKGIKERQFFEQIVQGPLINVLRESVKDDNTIAVGKHFLDTLKQLLTKFRNYRGFDIDDSGKLITFMDTEGNQVFISYTDLFEGPHLNYNELKRGFSLLGRGARKNEETIDYNYQADEGFVRRIRLHNVFKHDKPDTRKSSSEHSILYPGSESFEQEYPAGKMTFHRVPVTLL